MIQLAPLSKLMRLLQRQWNHLTPALSRERIPEPVAVIEGQHQRAGAKKAGQNQRGDVCGGKPSGHVPGAFLLLAEAAQFHGVADDIDPLHHGEEQRENNAGCPPDPVGELRLRTHLNAAGLLRVADPVVIFLDIRNIPQRNGNRVSYRIRNPDHVHRRGELTRIGRHEENKDCRRHNEVFEEHIEKIEELLRGQRMSGNS